MNYCLSFFFFFNMLSFALKILSTSHTGHQEDYGGVYVEGIGLAALSHSTDAHHNKGKV